MNQPLTVKEKGQQIQGLMQSRKDQFMQAMPAHIKFDKFVRVVMTSLSNTPKLLDCDRGDLMLKMMQCATLGLQPDGLNGEAYLIPFKNRRANRMDCQMIIGYKGLLKLARQSGELTSINAFVVRENDHISLNAFGGCSYEPLLKGDRGAVIGFLGVALFKENGAYQYRYMSVEDVEEVRDNAQGYKTAKQYAKNGVINSPWATHFEAMGEKTVIRRLCKLLPSSVELQNALHIESLQEAGKDYTFADGIVSEMQDVTPEKEALESEKLDNVGGNEIEMLKENLEQCKNIEEVQNIASFVSPEDETSHNLIQERKEQLQAEA